MLIENLQKLMKEKKLSQNQLAKKLNISSTAVSKWISGKNLPTSDKIIKICEIFEISSDELLGIKARAPDNLTLKEKELIKYYREMDERSKEYIIELANREASRGHPIKKPKLLDSKIS